MKVHSKMNSNCIIDHSKRNYLSQVIKIFFFWFDIINTAIKINNQREPH